ncbi:zinc transporter ZIP9 isoform X1 [Cebus imitator]|nr:zinc transporter ZIP9 isoform X1 [Cebus imitator]
MGLVGKGKCMGLGSPWRPGTRTWVAMEAFLTIAPNSPRCSRCRHRRHYTSLATTPLTANPRERSRRKSSEVQRKSAFWIIEAQSLPAARADTDSVSAIFDKGKKERLKLVTVLGAGLLCGTALAVIVPEGVHALYEDILEGKHHQASETHNVIASDKAAEMSVVHEHEHSHDHTQLHAYIGVSLVLGFVFMLLVDQIGNSHVHSTDDPEAARSSNSKITTTLGLVVHAAADGVALGAAASTSQTSVQLIVFVAIMLHKAPAAFGLVSFLMHAGLERNRIRKHLLVFALAAPVMSMLTYLGLSKSSKEALSEVNATGVAMLFSAGTFLYVATVHVLPEVGGIGHSHKPDTTGGRGLSRLEVAALVLGCLIPLILSIGHQH